MQPGAIERSPNHRRKEQAGMVIPVEQHEYLDWCQLIHECVQPGTSASTL